MKVSIGRGLATCFGVLILAGCGTISSRPTNEPHDPPGTIQPTAGAPQRCPLGMVGTNVAIADAADGVDISFTTAGDIEELRRRVRDQAANYGPGAHRGLGHGGAHSGAQTHGLRLSEVSSIDARVQDIEGGARLHVMTTDAAQMTRVRSEIHDRAARMVALGDCP